MRPATNDQGEIVATILVVDDQPASLLALKAVLEPLGQRVVTATSGAEALRCALEHDLALILMDVMMPDLDGYQTTALLRRRAHIPVIFLTAKHDNSRQARAYQHGGVDYLAKPIDPDFLRAKVSVFVSLYLQREHLEQQAETIRDQERVTDEARHAVEIAEAASAAKDEFLAMVSHELRTPLNAILGWGEMLLSGRLDAARARSAAETIVRNARAQSRLIEDLLDISRIISGKFHVERRPNELRALLENAVQSVRPFAAQRGIEIDAQLGTGACQVLVDANRLHQVVSNLLINAIKFTPKAGRVSLSLECDEAELVLCVSDAGVGIAPELLPHVFDRFRQADSTGTRAHGGLGLGLAIVRHIVELHDGTVEAHSDGPGKGARMTVRIPLQAPNAPESLAREASARITGELRIVPAPSGQSPLAGLSLLIVDDEADTIEMLRAMLEAAGAEVTAAQSVRDALAAVECGRFDLVVSDIGMPRESGLALARALGTRDPPRVPAIAVSAYSSADDKARSLEAGFLTHVAKPFDPSMLTALIGRLARRGAKTG